MRKLYPVVAHGNIISKCAATKVGDVEIGPLYWKIYIDIRVNPSKVLPRPFGCFQTVGDCVGATIA